MTAKSALVLGIVLTTTIAFAEEWPQWRGPRGDGISRETGLLEQWPADGLKKLWTVEVGQGYSSPVAVDGRIYVVGMIGQKDTLSAIDAETGQIVWRKRCDGGWTGDYPGSRASPVIQDNRIYTYSGLGDLVCWNRTDGKIVWQMNVLKETSGSNLTWGVSSSPLLVGDVIYVQGGVGNDAPIAVAVNKLNGNLLWQSEARGIDRQGAGYAQIIMAEIGRTKQVIVLASNQVCGMTADTGKTIWSLPWQTQYDVNASIPIYRDGHLFITSNYGKGCMIARLTPDAAEKLSESKTITGRFQPAILDGDSLYANSEGTIKCISWPEAQLRWTASASELKVGSGGTMLRAGDKLVLMSERGRLSLARATPEKIELIGQMQLFQGNQIWATPLIYRGRLYAKGASELVCLDFRK